MLASDVDAVDARPTVFGGWRGGDAAEALMPGSGRALVAVAPRPLIDRLQVAFFSVDQEVGGDDHLLRHPPSRRPENPMKLSPAIRPDARFETASSRCTKTRSGACYCRSPDRHREHGGRSTELHVTWAYIAGFSNNCGFASRCGPARCAYRASTWVDVGDCADEGLPGRPASRTVAFALDRTSDVLLENMSATTHTGRERSVTWKQGPAGHETHSWKGLLFGDDARGWRPQRDGGGA